MRAKVRFRGPVRHDPRSNQRMGWIPPGVESRAMSFARSPRSWIACALVLAGAGAARGDCRAWPGEPEPLPQVGTGDELLARWIDLRREELRGLALLIEPSDPLEARRLWLHAACLAPGDSEIAAALARTARPVVHRIEVAQGRPPALERRTSLRAALDVLDGAAWITPDGPTDADVADFDFAGVDAQLGSAALQLEQARFESAAGLADLARARLARLPAAPAVRERRVRLELVAATAHLALGELQEAGDCLQRALQARPDLTLDPAVSPPKLQRLFNEIRERR
jgi:tetratricopeptide (TPR) repeat protein